MLTAVKPGSGCPSRGSFVLRTRRADKDSGPRGTGAPAGGCKWSVATETVAAPGRLARELLMLRPYQQTMA